MADSDGYDSDLTSRIHAELDLFARPAPEEAAEFARLWERLNREFRGLLTDPMRRERVLAFLRIPTEGAPSPPLAGGTIRTLRAPLGEIADLSSRLDAASTGDASEGFALAESVADRAHLLMHTVEGFRAALDPEAAITGAFERFLALLSRLIRNAVEKMRAFAKLLDVSSFTVTFATSPPQVSVAFTFDTTK